MPIRTELQFRLPNSPGALADIASLLKTEQVRILGLSLDTTGVVRLVVDNATHAAATLARHHVRVDSHDVIWTLAPARSLDAVLTGLASAGINVEYAYAATQGDGPLAVVLGVDDAMRAASAAGV